MLNSKKRICIITSTRAEYGLLKHLMKEISSSDSLTLQIIATGAHLSVQHGFTIDEIKKDGFFIDEIIDLDINDDSIHSVCQYLSKLNEKLSTSFLRLSPDLLVILGDRYELMSVVSTSLIHRIPIAHIHGGEVTEGAFDENIRHSITKLSNLHFVASETYRNRVIQLGENPKFVYNVGGLGVDSIAKTKFLKKNILENELGIKFLKRNLIITYHPCTLDSIEKSELEVQELIKSLSRLKDTLQIFTMPNADPGNLRIFNIIRSYVEECEQAVYFKSLGQLKYYSCLCYVDGVLGNSSSGILEAPTFNIATINIGDRQKGRLFAKSVLNVKPDFESISEAISYIYTDSFISQLKDNINPYGAGGSSEKIVSILKRICFKDLLRKPFFDLEIPFSNY